MPHTSTIANSFNRVQVALWNWLTDPMIVIPSWLGALGDFIQAIAFGPFVLLAWSFELAIIVAIIGIII